MEKIPLVDLYAQYLTIKEEIDSAIHQTIIDTDFIRGNAVAKFERDFSTLHGVSHCISAANGTDSLFIILKMMGIGSGDEVITTSHSWIATSETISLTGATPIFVDTNDFYNIDENLIEEKINSRTKAILPVHLYGNPANMSKIIEIATKYNVPVIEDCAQAHLARHKDTLVGTFGLASSFSFYPGKNLGAYGDAGCILTNDDELAEKCRMFANHGSLKKHEHVMEGINSRLDGMQAAILNVKLPYLQEWTNKRNQLSLNYNKGLDNVGDLTLPVVKSDDYCAYHLYVIKTEKRDALKQFLESKGIATTIQYPVALPFLKAYERLDLKTQDFPKAYENQSAILSLPLYPELSNEKQDYIIKTIKSFFN